MQAWRNLFFVPLYILFVASSSFAAESPSHTAVVKGPFCGLLSVYAALRAEGVKIEFPDLLKDKYISSPLGSNSAELISAINDNGLYALPLSHLSTRSLSSLRTPTILHVKGDQYSKKLDHFVTYFGTEGGNFKIFDTPGEVRYIRPGELELLWDGDGILVSKSPISRTAVQIEATLPYVIGFAVIGGIIAVAVWRLKRGTAGRARSFKHATIILVTSFAWGMAFDYFNETSSFASATRSLAAPPTNLAAVHDLPTVDFAGLQAARRAGATLIDARLSSDYDAGHIPGAISIPVNAFMSELQESLNHHSPDEKLILYCQSTNCEFSDVIAKKLVAAGYANIGIYRGGWTDWCKNGQGN